MMEGDAFNYNNVFMVLSNEGLLDINESIFSLLSAQEICILRLVCKRFCNFIDNQKFWHLKLKAANIKAVFQCKDDNRIDGY